MKIMYDSVNPNKIPSQAEAVAGYLDGPYKWSSDGWARFKSAVLMGICIDPKHDIGNILDVEPGDSTPEHAVDWVLNRRKAGIVPVLYTNKATLPFLQKAFRDRKVAECSYWLAWWNGRSDIPAGCVAHQFQNAQDFDLSVIADSWAGQKEAQAKKNKAVVKEASRRASPTFSYRIKWGDTLTGIARKYRTTVHALCSLNQIKDPNFIRSGSIIQIPTTNKK